MKYRVLNDEVLYSEERHPRLTEADLDVLTAMAAANERKRIRLCTHADAESRLQEMFIVHGRDCYVRPHKHTDKDECLHVLRGSADMIFFDEGGEVAEVVPLGASGGERAFACRVPMNVYHMLIIRSDVLVFSEATTGPFDREKMVFADWAPEDGRPEAWEYVAEVQAGIEKERKP